MKPSYFNSMTSQIVLMICVAIVLMQLYQFYLNREVLDIFNTLASMVLWAYFQKQLPESKEEPLTDDLSPNKLDAYDNQQ